MTQIHARLLALRLCRSEEAHRKGVGWHYTPLPGSRHALPITSSDQPLENSRTRRPTAEVGLAPRPPVRRIRPRVGGRFVRAVRRRLTAPALLLRSAVAIAARVVGPRREIA